MINGGVKLEADFLRYLGQNQYCKANKKGTHHASSSSSYLPLRPTTFVLRAILLRPMIRCL